MLFLRRVEHEDFTAMLPAVVEEQGFAASWVIHDALTILIHDFAEFFPGFVVQNRLHVKRYRLHVR